MEIPPGERFTVEVHLMVEPCLWCWEIRDRALGRLIRSSWIDEWTAYESREDALRTACLRLTQAPRSLSPRAG